MCAETPSYYTDNPFQILRQKRREAEERRRAAFIERYGETVNVGVSKPKVAEDYGRRMGKLARLREIAARIVLVQGGSCYLCGEEFSGARPATQDHVIPKAKRGRNRHNILMAHLTCNWEKADRMPTPDELAYLRRVNVALANDEVAGPRVFRGGAG